MNIIRVFPQRASYTPDDDMVFIGEPPGMLIPPHDEVHISCTFTWDKPYSEYLKYQWEMYTDKPVKLSGVAYGSPATDFTPGLYVKKGITFTSRGCNNSCAWCAVSQREGKLRELPITTGNIIQDNNFLHQPIDGEKISYHQKWRKFRRSWCRPAAINAHMKHGTDFKDFNT